jgi:O-antigen ligase
VFLLIMVIPLLSKLLSGYYGKIMLTDILMMMHLIWATVALAVNNPNQVVQQIGSVGIEFIGGYLMGRAYIRTPESFVALSRWLVFLVLSTLPLALFEAKTGRPLLIEAIHKLPGLTSVAVVTIDGRMGLERVQGVFAHPIHYGLFCSVALSLAFVVLRDITSPGRRWLSSVLIAMCGFLALSSGALLAIVLQTALITWSNVFAKIRWRWWLLVGLFVLAYIIIDIFSNRAPLQVFMSYATFSAHNAYYRSIIFDWGMRNIWAHPIFGLGLNDWVRPFYMVSGTMDNFWLVMGVRYGIPGFFLLGCAYSVMIFRVMRLNFEGDVLLTKIRLAWVFTFLGLSFTLTTVHIWTNIYSFVFFMFGAGAWLLEARKTGQPSISDTPVERPGSSLAPASAYRRQMMMVAVEPDTERSPGPRSHYSRFPVRNSRKDGPKERL